ncbi:MAG TPA: aldose 1-epimerase [Flavihumibacter sp.]|nr:aldose 1-epimerase [Bacteroidota bacterium]HOA39601.1 aldose 1-epimerase [Flavihumibacter sp.]HPZ88369.1 aldose 1-epimerase [Flavihumibacter sp.]
MSFRISAGTHAGIPLVYLHDDTTRTEIAIAPTHGALLHGFSFPLQGITHNIIDSYLDEADLERNLSTSFKSSKLSPFPCRIPEGRYHFNNKDYQFEKLFPDGTAIHGLLFNKSFTETSKTVTDFMASAQFDYAYRADDGGYPFHYDCRIDYTLFSDQLLQIKTSLTNQGNEAIPMADGWHPYFSLGGKVDGYNLQFAAEGMLEFSDKLIPTGNLLPIDDFRTGSPLNDRQLDNCFVLDRNTGNPVCTLHNPENGITVSFETDGQYPYLQLYIPPQRRSIAIENLTSAPDAFNNKMGLITLAPGESRAFTVYYRVNTDERA